MTSVYFIEATDVGRVKIGISDNPRRRMESFKTGCPSSLILFGTIECPDRPSAEMLERALHKFFWKHKAVREWFHLDARTEHFIRYLLGDGDYQTALKRLVVCIDEFYE